MNGGTNPEASIYETLKGDTAHVPQMKITFVR